MRDHFQSVIHGSDDLSQASCDQDEYFQSEPDKCDLQDACCYFLEHDKLPRFHLARANLMMVWLIETETESARYADIAGEIIGVLESDMAKMFGFSDGRVEQLKEDLQAAQLQVAVREIDAYSFSEDDEMEDDEDNEEDVQEDL